MHAGCNLQKRFLQRLCAVGRVADRSREAGRTLAWYLLRTMQLLPVTGVKKWLPPSAPSWVRQVSPDRPGGVLLSLFDVKGVSLACDVGGFASQGVPLPLGIGYLSCVGWT